MGAHQAAKSAAAAKALRNDYDIECSHKDKMTFVRFTYDQWRTALEKENLEIAEGRSGESPGAPSSPRKRCLCVSYSSPTKRDVGKVAAELNLVTEGTLLESEK
ncbi:hypothetical protein FOZ62_014448, partial [Perkinsus olseni]